MTKDEWNKKFVTEFEHEIEEFRQSDKTLFNNDVITNDLKHHLRTLIRYGHLVQLDIKQEVNTHRFTVTMFIVTDYHKVQFIVSEFCKGRIYIAVRKEIACVYMTSFDIAEYTKSEELMQKLRKIIDVYISLFISTMNAQNSIELIKTLENTKNI